MSQSSRACVFISYAHEDRQWRQEFETMLAPARERGLIHIWSDEDIEAGASWSRNIQLALSQARVGLLLVSEHFLQSEFINEVELGALLKAAERERVSIRWVPISPSLYRYSQLADIQAAWDPEKPLATLSRAEQKAAIQRICLEIVELFGEPAVSEGRRGSLRARIEERIGDRYTIGDELATGKFSIVYRAERKFPKRPVVVKALVASEIDDWARRAFTESIERASDLVSPAFIKVIDHALSDSPECLVSEYVAGEQLSSLLWKHPDGLPLPQVRSILLDLARAIDEAHRHGWRRGELYPSNIMLDESGVARISPVDFTNVLREEHQLAGNFLVDRESLSYMTPERFHGFVPNLLSDQYSLGLVAIELLAGRQIPAVVHPRDLLDKPQLFADLEAGKGEWALRSPELAGVVSRMLRQDPDERWPSMTDVLHLVEGIEVEPDERLRKIARAGYLRLQASAERQCDFFARFYRTLFASDRGIEQLFATIDMDRQYRLLNQAIHALLEFRPRSASTRPELIAVASRHARLGLEKRHYGLFLEAIVKTVEESEGDPIEPRAWRETLQPGIEFLWECEERVRAALGNAEGSVPAGSPHPASGEAGQTSQT